MAGSSEAAMHGAAACMAATQVGESLDLDFDAVLVFLLES
jgi:hypothetical protein